MFLLSGRPPLVIPSEHFGQYRNDGARQSHRRSRLRLRDSDPRVDGPDSEHRALLLSLLDRLVQRDFGVLDPDGVRHRKSTSA